MDGQALICHASRLDREAADSSPFVEGRMEDFTLILSDYEFFHFQYRGTHDHRIQATQPNNTSHDPDGLIIGVSTLSSSTSRSAIRTAGRKTILPRSLY
ncbi:hypothetical protein WSS_A38291 [Rhodococcus opacus M213]|uniref:Uncharacterized protein n=1 Tax=Rhodococcus opacus M213 TaxID=1129896 RepID=K8X6Y4_RHOOP|nr:hypothetical protein [Rhodococcus opacus]EKT77334.1 hypothetical protein WSS_A38291 [Rhodococcus opacus M213]